MEHERILFSIKDAGHGIKFLAIGIFIIYKATGNLKLYRFKKTLPLSKIRSLALGPVHLKGNLLSKNRFISLFSEKSGILVIRQLELCTLKGWENFSSQGLWEDLYMEDTTGKVEIDPAKFENKLKLSFEYNSWFSKQKPKNIGKVRSAFNFEMNNNLLGIKFPKLYRYREYIVYDNDVVEIFGEAISARNKEYLVISNPKDRNFVFQQDNYKEVPYGPLINLFLGLAVSALGIIISVLSTEGVASIQGIIIWIGIVLFVGFLYLKHYKII